MDSVTWKFVGEWQGGKREWCGCWDTSMFLQNWPRTLLTSLTPQYDFRPSLCIAYYIISTGCHVSSRICYPCFLSESSCKQCAYGKRGHAQTAAERFAVLAPSYDKPKQAAEDFEKSRGIEGYWRNDIILNSWNILRLLLLDEFLVVLFVHCVTIYLEMIWLWFDSCFFFETGWKKPSTISLRRNDWIESRGQRQAPQAPQAPTSRESTKGRGYSYIS